MRLPKILGAACAISGLLVAFGASAGGENYSVASGGGKVTVTPKGAWHINKDFPWKLKCGGTTLDKSKFSLSETSASVSGGSGACELKGALCSGDKCEPFSANVSL